MLECQRGLESSIVLTTAHSSAATHAQARIPMLERAAPFLSLGLTQALPCMLVGSTLERGSLRLSVPLLRCNNSNTS